MQCSLSRSPEVTQLLSTKAVFTWVCKWGPANVIRLARLNMPCISQAQEPTTQAHHCNHPCTEELGTYMQSLQRFKLANKREREGNRQRFIKHSFMRRAKLERELPPGHQGPDSWKEVLELKDWAAATLLPNWWELITARLERSWSWSVCRRIVKYLKISCLSHVVLIWFH